MSESAFAPRPAHWMLPVLIAGLTWLAILLELDPAGTWPSMPQGPGVTIDESFNVQQGVVLVEFLKTYHVALLHPETLEETFGGPFYLPDHPPLGRFAIGVAHGLGRGVTDPVDHPSPFVTACGRVAPATAFAFTVFLVGWYTTRFHGRAAGVLSAIGTVCMPRLFGHAHLAALETMIGLATTAVVLASATAWGADARPTRSGGAWLGVLMGLALLTKIQAVLLPVPLVVWSAWRWRQAAIVPLVVAAGVAFVVFFAGWPWLWLDPAAHLREYFGSATDRVSLTTFYGGQKYPDTEVPWHYPFVMFAVTVPVGLQLLAGIGAVVDARGAESRGRAVLLLGAILFPLCVFALPGTAVYDGTRLFLFVFPLWAVFIGRGGRLVWEWLSTRMSPRWAAAVFVGAFAAQGWGVVAMSPCWLSYYSLAAGGTAGAERLGFETSYWGDALSRELLAEIPDGAVVDVTPTMHQFQVPDLLEQSPDLRRRGVTLRAFSQEREPAEYVLVFARRADVPPISDGWQVVGEIRRGGVRLSALYATKSSGLGLSNGSRERPLPLFAGRTIVQEM